MCDVSMFPSSPAAFVSPSRLLLRVRVGILMFSRPCARGDFCDASGAEAGFSPGRCCAASLCTSCAGIKILSQELVKFCISELSVLPLVEVSLGGGDQRCKKMVFPAAIREKSQRWVALSCDAHLVPAG